MSHIVVIGCGVVGAAIAYELSLVPGRSITVLDQQNPAQGATSAALGVLMGIISHKIKGKAWQMRQTSIQRYETLIPELAASTHRHIPFNQQGILKLCFAEENMANWQNLAKIRHSQGLSLEIWDSAQVKSKCPEINCEQIIGAIYSPDDRQVDPVALTLALVEAAQRNGVTFHFGVAVDQYYLSPNSEDRLVCRQIKTKSVAEDAYSPLIENVDWLVISAGLGSLPSIKGIQGWTNHNSHEPSSEISQMLDIRPVLGQAIQLNLPQPLGDPNFQPVITGDDVHIVPVENTFVTDLEKPPESSNINQKSYWIGATVEFPSDTGEIVSDAACLEAVIKKAIAFCPTLASGTIVKTWSGLRPRPEGRPAPIIGHLPGYNNVLVATGHYRNGVLLAPATADAIRNLIIS